MKEKRRWLLAGLLLFVFAITGCSFLHNAEKIATAPDPIVVGNDVQDQTEADAAADRAGQNAEAEEQKLISEIEIESRPHRDAIKAKGIYISAYVAGTPAMVDNLLQEFDKTEANALVIDFKDDFGRVVCETESPLINQLGSTKVYIEDMAGLMQKLKEHNIYTIARIPAFRDAWLFEAQPDWCVKKSDGTVFKDRDDHAWVNPYKQEAWDYLTEVALEAKKLGFDEIQFDYVRFCTEKGMRDAVFDEEDTKGRSRTDIILEFMEYEYEKLSAEGLFVSADVFGAIINSDVNADSVGQIYGEMAKHLDYISPMIYPSHYSDGNYGIDHPDMRPYDTICAALTESRKELYFAGLNGEHVAEVRPWLQDFTASWLKNHIPYGGEQVRDQIRAVYDCGYNEWLLWDAACTYDWDGLLTPEAAEEEQKAIEASRAGLPETTYAPEEAGHDALTVPPDASAQTGAEERSGDGAQSGGETQRENSASAGKAGAVGNASSGKKGEKLAVGDFPAAQALSEALETVEEPGTPPETGTTLPPIV